MAFKFKLEALLRHRKRLEEEAQKVYLRAQSQVNDKLKQVEDMYAKIEGAREEIQHLIKTGQFTAHHGDGLESFIQGSNKLIEIYRMEARELMTLAERAQDDLLEKRLEYKTLEKLREKKHQEFLYTKKKKEQKSTEDIVNMRHGRG